MNLFLWQGVDGHHLGGDHRDVLLAIPALIGDRVGVASALDTSQQESLVNMVRATIPPLEQTLQQSIATLASIPGNLPDLRRGDLPACRFHARCDRALVSCAKDELPDRACGAGHEVRCFNPL